MRLHTIATLVGMAATFLAVSLTGCGAPLPATPGIPAIADGGDTPGFRAPSDFPDWLQTSGPRHQRGPDHLPYLVQLWEGPAPEPTDGPTVSFGGIDWPAGSAPQGVVFGATAREMEMDLEGAREPATADGVQGWLWRLDESDFLPPLSHAKELVEQQELSRAGVLRERLMYLNEVRHVRAYDDAHTRIPFTGHLLSGRAIALQWNRDGVHYILIAKDKPPMTEETLFRMANSLVPVKDAK